MTIQRTLLLNNRLLVYKLEGLLNIDDMGHILNADRGFYDQAFVPVYTVFDVTRLTQLPRHVIAAFRQNSNVCHPMAGVTFVALQTPFMAAMVRLAIRLVPPGKVRVVETLEQGIEEAQMLMLQETVTV